MKATHALLALLLSQPALAADHEHKFLHNDFDPAHCWTVPSGQERTAPAMTPLLAAPLQPGKSPGLALEGEGISPMGADPQLAVSPHYVLVLEAHQYVFYDRATNKPLASSGCVPVSTSFSNLFAPLILATDPATNQNNPGSINYQLEFGSSPKFPCNPADYLDKSSSNPSGCIQGNYDTRAYYDYDTNRFWIVAAARNHIWACPSTSPCGDEARRYVFVAVSKAEDPRKGFWEYVLVRDYADWPLFSVRNKRLVIGHNDGGAKRVYVFDSQKLLSGTTTDPYLGKYFDDSFKEASVITPVTQYSDADGLTLLLGRSGSKLTVYAFKDPNQPLIKNSQTLSSSLDWPMQPVYRFSKFYFAHDNNSDGSSSRRVVDVHRVTAALDGSPITVGAISEEHWSFKNSGLSFRMPGVIIEETGGMIVWYLQFPTDGTAQSARYQVLYGNESAFRDSAVLRTSDKVQPESFVGDLQIGGAAEPGAVGFWITHLYANSSGSKLQVVGKVEPGCGTLSMCDQRCYDFNTDHAHCGSCKTECSAKQQCLAGKCLVLPKPPPACSGKNFMTDAKNCGGCGRVCPEGRCVNGRCCDPCICYDGFVSGACRSQAACEHICRGHEPH